MRKLLFLLLAATMFAASATAQNDPHSLSVRRQYTNAIIPSYVTGGFKVLVKNNTTGELEQTSYTVVTDTVNGTRTFIANGASNVAFQVTTPTTYKQLISAGRIGIAGNIHLKDSSGSKYLDLDSHDGITAYDTLWNNANFFRFETIFGTKSFTGDSTKLRVDCGKIAMGSSATPPIIKNGTGTPLYNLNAPVGSMFIRTDGGLDSAVYVKMVGATDSAGWYPLKH